MILTGTEIVCPRARPGDSPLLIDLKEIAIAKGRQVEVACVTNQKAPELLMVFNESWRELHKLVTILTAEKNAAEAMAERRKAVVTLDITPGYLKAKGVTSTADSRQAVLVLDVEYQQACEKVDEISAILELLKGDMKSFENSYNSVKKIMNDFSHIANTRDPHLSVGDSESRVFGKARY